MGWHPHTRIAGSAANGPETPRIGCYRHGHLGYAHHWIWPVIEHWKLYTFDARPPCGIAFQLDSACQAYISYFEEYRGDLRYFYPTLSGSRTDTVDANNDVEHDAYSSLALDELSQPRISFYDDTYGGLSLAYKVYGVFLPSVVHC
jgi:hypothetical protein